MHAVLGATGNTGRAVVDRLIAHGARVRVVLRDAAKGEAFAARGCEVAIASTDDADTLAAALAGVDGAYLLIPPPYAEPDFEGVTGRIGATIASAASAARVPHVVALSSVGAHMPSGNGAISSLTVFERELGKAGLRRTILRPAYFMSNWGGVIPLARDQGILPTMLQPPGRPTQMVSTDDIGETAADLLLEPHEGERIVHLAGPQDYAPDDVAAALGRLLARGVQTVTPPAEAWPQILTEAGLSRSYAEGLAVMYRGLNDGSIGFPPGAEIRRGSTSLEAALARLL